MKVNIKIGSFSLSVGEQQAPPPAAVAPAPLVAKNESSASTLHDGAILASHARTLLYWASRNYNQEVPRFSRSIQVGKARKLYANDGFSRGAINAIARYSVGKGIAAIAHTSNPEWNTKAQLYFQNWARISDWTGRMTLTRMLRIISQAVDRDGDIGILMLKTPTGFPKIQLIESHRIGDYDDDSRTPLKDGSSWVDGVRMYADGTVAEYSIITIAVDGTRKRMLVDPANFILVMDPERVDQARGVTAFSHAINTLHDRLDLLSFEKKGVKTDSTRRAVLKTDSGSVDGADWDTEEVEVDGKKVIFAESEGGDTHIIATNEELTPWDSNRPSPTFTGFLDHLIRDVSLGLGVPFEFVWSPEKLGGSGNRLILEQAQRKFEERQDLLIETVLNRLWFWVISSAIKRGELEPNSEAYMVEWQRPSEITVDAGRDSNNEREDVKFGLMTEAESYSKRGKDWRVQRLQKETEVRDLLERAKKIAADYDLPVPLALQLLQMLTPNGNLATPPQQGGAKPTTQEPSKPAPTK